MLKLCKIYFQLAFQINYQGGKKNVQFILVLAIFKKTSKIGKKKKHIKVFEMKKRKKKVMSNSTSLMNIVHYFLNGL